MKIPWWIRELNFWNFRKAILLIVSDPSGKQLRSLLKEIDQNQKLYFTQAPVREFYLEDGDTPDRIEPRTLAIVHLYFSEYVSTFLRAATQYKPNDNIEILVTTPLQEIADQISIATKSLDIKVSVVVVPNRGRNLGPFFIESRNRLQRFEFITHVHSKKSTHTKSSMAKEWSSRSWDLLFADKKKLIRALELARKHSNIAVAYPDVSDLLPPWAYSWLSNLSNAKAWYRARDLNFHQSRIAYPAGGMFLLNVSNMQQLYSDEYVYEDFPDEKGQLDGELHHLLERLLGTVPLDLGLKHLIYSESEDKFTSDLHFITNGLHITPGRTSLDIPKHFETVTFDFFDTLYRRKSYLEDAAKFRLGQALEEQTGISPRKFVELRNATELNLRKKKNYKDDVTLAEVAEELSRELKIDAKILKMGEESHELELAEPKTKYIEFLKKCIELGKDVAIVSDTFYSAEFVSILGRKIGIPDGVPYFISSELGLRKDRGDIWDYVGKRMQIHADKHLHVGDNEISDIQIPNGLGFTVMQCPTPLMVWTLAGHRPETFLDLEPFSEKAWLLGKIMSDFAEAH